MIIFRAGIVSSLVLITTVFLVFFTVQVNGSKKLVIDNDAGTDDAIAIFMALIHEKHFGGYELVALTTANGNTAEENVNYNDQRILKIAQRQDVPIYRGAKKSIVITPNTTDYFGKDGMGDIDEHFDDLVPAQDKAAVHALIDLSKQYEGELVVVVIGPVTNVALAMYLDPGFLSRLDHLYIGAGQIYSSMFPTVEFNLEMDVEAYRMIADNATPDKVTIFPYSQVKLYLNITLEWRLNVFGAIDSDIVHAINKYEEKVLKKELCWYNLDPAVLAAILNPKIVTEYKYYKNNVYLCGDQRGINTNTEENKEIDANVRAIFRLDQEKYKNYLLDVFSLS